MYGEEIKDSEDIRFYYIINNQLYCISCYASDREFRV
jgi:hypothetical protein